MAASNLLTLIDDIATILDDVAVMSKAAAKKTAGVLGDDLALNAEQVTGVQPDREWPVIFKVAVGSFINKIIIIPGALLLSQFAPVLITPLLFLGGSFLCFEGTEKVIDKFFRKKDKKNEKTILNEKDKIKGAIRTDFILSLEVIVIVLGTVADAPFVTRLLVLTTIGLGMTFGVYGLVALIVKIDDAGLYLKKKATSFAQLSGDFLLAFAPRFMKVLGAAGTIAMFLVGGGIVVHVFSPLEHFRESIASLLAMPFDGVIGLAWGLILVLLLSGLLKLKKLVIKPAS